MEIERTSAVVTGGASGLGEAVVRALRCEGASVALFDVAEGPGESLAAESGASFFHADVTDAASLAGAFVAARSVQGQERILVCCAGIARSIPIASNRPDGAPCHPFEEFERIIDVNLVGTFRCMALSAAGMIGLPPLDDDGQRGVIVCTGSIAAEDGAIGQAAYSASKAGIAGMMLPVARDLGPFGVRTAVIHPGAFRTPLLARLPRTVIDAMTADCVFPKRTGHPQEFAEAVLYVCRSDMVNAAALRLDAGIRMRAGQTGIPTGEFAR